MQFFPAAPEGDDQIGPSEDAKMFADGLARHAEALAKLSQSLAVSGMQLIQQLAAAGVGKGSKDAVHGALNIVQLKGCMSKKRAFSQATRQRTNLYRIK